MDLNQFSTVDIVLDKANDNFIQKQTISAGDRNGRSLTLQVTNEGSIGEVPGLTANLLWTNHSSGLSDLSAFSVVDRLTSVFKIDYPQNMLTAGKVTAQIQLLHNGKVTHSKKFEIIVLDVAGKLKGVLQKAEYTALVEALAKTNEFETDIAVLDNGKVDKGGNEQVTIGMLSQQVKEIMAGANALPVVTENSVNTSNVVEGAITASKTDFIEINKSKNLINPKYLQKGYLSLSGIVADDNYRTTQKIPVKINDIVRYTLDVELGTNNSLYFYDINGNYISRVAGTASASNTFRTVSITGASIASVAFSYHISTLAMLTVNNDFPSIFEEFKDELYPIEKMKLNEAQKDELLAIIPKPTNPLMGKVLAVNGDSIMYGAGFVGGFAKIIATQNEMELENKAVSGGTITAGVYQSNGTTPRHWICRDINNMRYDADFIILEGGINDSTLSAPIGAISAGWDAILDDTTFCGAVESMLKQAILKWPGKKIGFILTHFASSSQQTYFPYIRTACIKWGVPYLDLFEQVPPIRYIDHLKNTFTSNADGVHPNELGYRAFYVDRVTAWMQTL